MKDINPICKIALVQAEPILFDKKASLAKALEYIEESASQKSELNIGGSIPFGRTRKKPPKSLRNQDFWWFFVCI